MLQSNRTMKKYISKSVKYFILFSNNPEDQFEWIVNTILNSIKINLRFGAQLFNWVNALGAIKWIISQWTDI